MNTYARYAYVFFGLLLLLPMIAIASHTDILLAMLIGLVVLACAVAGCALIAIGIIAPVTMGRRRQKQPRESASSVT